MKNAAVLAFSLGLVWSVPGMARPTFPTLIPNNSLSCSMCHAGTPSKATLNDIGLDVQDNLDSSGQSFNWADVCPLDSDADSFSNGVELQDPDCTWTPGNPAPGDPALVTNPGDPDSKPEGTADGADAADAADTGDAADAADTGDAVDAADAADTGDAADAADTGDAADAADAADTGDAADVSDAADTADAADTGDATDAADAADTGDATDATDASSGGTTTSDDSGCTTGGGPSSSIPAVFLLALMGLFTARRRIS